MTVPIFANRRSGPWTPRALGPNLVQWLRSDLGVTTDGGSPARVISWADQSGRGYHATQTTAGSRPTYSPTGGPGGRSCIDSDTLSATPWLDVNSLVPAVPSVTGVGWTVITVQTCRTIPGVAASHWTTTAGVTPADGSSMQWRRDAGNRLSIVMANVVPGPTFLTVVTPDMNPVNTWIATIFTVDATENRTSRCYGDGATGSSTDAKTSNTNIELANKRIFRDGAVYYQSLALSELITVDRPVTAAEIVQIQNYFRNQWGLAF